MAREHIFPSETRYIPTFLTPKEVWEYIGASNGYSAIQPTNKNTWLSDGPNHNFGDIGKIAVSFGLFIEIVFCTIGGNHQSKNREDTDIVNFSNNSRIGQFMATIVARCSDVLFNNNDIDKTYLNVYENSIDPTQKYRNGYIKLLTKQELRICLSIVNLSVLEFGNLDTNSLKISQYGTKKYSVPGQFEYDYEISKFFLKEDLMYSGKLPKRKHSEIATVNDIKIDFGGYKRYPAITITDAYFLSLARSSARGYGRFSYFGAYSNNNFIIPSSNREDEYGSLHLWFSIVEYDRQKKLKFLKELKTQLDNNSYSGGKMYLSKSVYADRLQRENVDMSASGDINKAVLNFYRFLMQSSSDEAAITFNTQTNKKLLNTYTFEEIINKGIKIAGTIRNISKMMFSVNSIIEIRNKSTYEQKYMAIVNAMNPHDSCKLVFNRSYSDEYSFDMAQESWITYESINGLSEIMNDTDSFPAI